MSTFAAFMLGMFTGGLCVIIGIVFSAHITRDIPRTPKWEPVHVGLSYLVDEWREPTEAERSRGVGRVITKATLTGASFVSPPSGEAEAADPSPERKT